jgi:hypothetical protein
MRGGRLGFCNFCTEDDQKLDRGRGPARCHSIVYVTVRCLFLQYSSSASHVRTIRRLYVCTFIITTNHSLLRLTS